MAIEDKITVEKLLTEKLGKQMHYHQVKLVNMNILQVKKYYLLMKVK